jgi:ABC-2 type transport system ATP-binding protein
MLAGPSGTGHRRSLPIRGGDLPTPVIGGRPPIGGGSCGRPVEAVGAAGRQDRSMSMIHVRDLRKVYGDRTVVDGISFTVHEGEIFGILGPNGAGKTTTVECIGGLRRPDAGSIRVAGLDPTREGRAFRETLGIQLQESRLPDKQTVAEALQLFSSFYSRPRDWRELAERLGLTSQLDRYFGKLSGGQKQRLSVALALIGNPRVAILDELTTGLDPAARREVWGLLEDLKGTGVTLLLVSHFMEEAERLCDRVVVIDHGRIIAADTPEGLAAGVVADQRMSFVPSAPIEPALLSALPDVHTVGTAGDRIVVTGTDSIADSVIIALHERGIAVTRLRVDQPSLDDAFVALTRDEDNTDGPAGLARTRKGEPA